MRGEQEVLPNAVGVVSRKWDRQLRPLSTVEPIADLFQTYCSVITSTLCLLGGARV